MHFENDGIQVVVSLIEGTTNSGKGVWCDGPMADWNIVVCGEEKKTAHS